MSSEARSKILCVDDEPQVLTLLVSLFRRHFDVATAPSGTAGLEVLQHDPDVSVIVSDMHMPSMDGATFLSQSRQFAPDATRVLLTGQTDIQSAIAAVNNGQIFRFLSKPCPPAALLITVKAAIEQHRLITAEKVLLEQTLHGCVKALIDILALANPMSFGRALRIKQHAADLALHLGLADRWRIEVAAMLSQMGLITLPADTAEKVVRGAELSAEEVEMVGKMPAVVEQLLANIPRLEDVREILAAAPRPYRSVNPKAGPREAAIRHAAHVLKIAMDFDELDARGLSPTVAIGMLRGRHCAHDPSLLTAFEAVRTSRSVRMEVRELKLASLRPGMIFDEDVKLVGGALLVARGYEITNRFLDRIGNFAAGSIRDPLRVIVSIAPLSESAEADAPRVIVATSVDVPLAS